MFVARINSGIYYIILFFIVLLVFEESIYGHFSLSPLLYVAVKTLSEIILYVLLMLIIMTRMVSRKIQTYYPTRFDILLVAFVIIAIVSSFLNQGGLFESVLNLRTMLRYVTIYYIIVLSNWVPTKRQLMQIFKFIIVIALIQSGIALLQNVMGKEFTEAYFSATRAEVNIGDISSVLNAMRHKLGAGFGTFGKTATYAMFLLIAGILILAVVISGSRKTEWKWWIGYSCITLGIFYSYKRGPLLLAFFAPFVVAWILGNKKILKLYSIIGSILALVFIIFLLSKNYSGLIKEKEIEISPLESLTQLFTAEYWERTSSSSRGWMIIEVGAEALSSFKLFGYGADEENAKQILSLKGGKFAKLVGWGAFDDVYIIASLVYFGPIGLFVLLLAFAEIFRKAKYLYAKDDDEYRILGIVVVVILIFMLLASFMVRVLEFRAYAFIFWMFAGIVVSVFKNQYLFEGETEVQGRDPRVTLSRNQV